MSPQPILAAAVLVSALALASPAAAATRFVDDGGNNNGGANTCLSAAAPCQTIAHAVLQAVSNDTIQIAPGAYTESVTAPGTESLDFEGPAAGPGPPPPGVPDPAVHATITSAGAAPALHLQGGGAVTNLRLKGADGASFGPALQLGTGMNLGTRTYAVTNVVAIGGVNGSSGRAALVVTDAVQPDVVQIDATVTGSHFTSSGTNNDLGIVQVHGAQVSAAVQSATLVGTGAQAANGLLVNGGASGALTASTVTGAGAGVRVTETGSDVQVIRSRVDALLFGIFVGTIASATNTTATVVNSVFAVEAALANAAAAAVTQFGDGASLTARGTTFFVRGPDPETGLRVSCICGAGNSASANLTNSIVRMIDTSGEPSNTDVRVSTSAGTAAFTAAHSSFSTLFTDPGSGTVTATQPGSGTNLLGDPLFTDSVGGDFTLQAASPLIERGDPAVVVPGELDAAGAPRAQDVDCDGVAVPDIGAFERAGAPGPCPPPGPAGGAGGGGAGAGGAGATDMTPPVLGPLSVTNSIFRVATARASQRRRPRGTRFRFRLSEDAAVAILIERRTLGRRVGRRCRPASRRLRGRRPCVRYVRAGTLSTAGVAGQNVVAFRGRIGRRALRPGRYRATAIATDAAGNSSSRRRVTFRIVRR